MEELKGFEKGKYKGQPGFYNPNTKEFIPRELMQKGLFKGERAWGNPEIGYIKEIPTPMQPQENQMPMGVAHQSTTQEEPMTLGGLASNVGSNLKGIATGLVQTAMHPIQTGKTMLQLGAGIPAAMEEKLGIVRKEDLPPFYQQGIEMAKGVGTSALEAAKHPLRTAYEHPIDVGLMAAPALSGASKLANVGGLGRTAKVLEKASGIVNPMNPVEAVAKAPIKAAGNLIKDTSIEKLYIKAIKPLADTPEEMHQVASFGIKKGATVRYNTWLNINDEISQVLRPVKETIEAGTLRGDTASLQRVLEGLDEIKKSAHRLSAEPMALVKAVDRRKKQLTEFFDKYRNGDVITPRDLQDLKQINQQMSKYGELNAATKDAINKGTAYETKRTLEQMYPEIKDANLKAHELIEFNKHLGKAVSASEKRDLVTNIAFMVKAIADQPYLKSKVAIWLNRAKHGKLVTNPQSIGGAGKIALGSSAVNHTQRFKVRELP